MAGPAHATFPGPNGKIAFGSARGDPGDIWVMNPDGTGQVDITTLLGSASEPAWAPNGRYIAFTRATESVLYVTDAGGHSEYRVTPENTYAHSPAWSPDGSELVFVDFGIVVIDASGDGVPRRIADAWAPGYVASPDWSPRGDAIVFSRGESWGDRYGCWQYADLKLIDPAGTTETALTNGPSWRDTAPSFSPDGETVVFARKPDPCFRPAGPADLYTVPVDGGTPTQLTDTPGVHEEDPVWSPDGTKIAFAAGPEREAKDIYVMNADGSGREQLTTDPAGDGSPSWRGAVTPAPGFPRPKTARSIRVPLVPAYAECTAPNRTHGPPLAFGSCSPPEGQLASDTSAPGATFGTPEVNGYPARASGYVRFTSVTGDPSTAQDEADVRIRMRLTDVRDAADPAADFAYSLALPLPVRITDKNNGCCGDAGTVRDVDPLADVQLQVEAYCSPAGPAPTIGATCEASTTADALLPGLVPEGKRSVWQFVGPLEVYDSGPDREPATMEDNAPLATQGLFVP
jgi:Tol biopolymer transport system component